MLANANLVSANSTPFPYLVQRLKLRPSSPTQTHRSFRSSYSETVLKVSAFCGCRGVSSFALSLEDRARVFRRGLRSQNSGDPVLEKGISSESELGGGGNGGQGGDWTTSILLFVLWGALIYYVFILSPNQTPSRDVYFLRKLLYLKGDDGFRMNQVLVCLWNIMGLWPLVYSMLLLPTGRSSKSKVPVWPFLVLSFFGGVYVLLPYFILWNPPQPPIEETELGRWPLNFLESKVTAGALLAAGLGLISYAGLAGGVDWKEFWQYFRESKLVHVTTIDFTLLSAFAPFWVYNDMTSRKWFNKGYWLLLLSLVPLLGPALYLLLRPALSPSLVSTSKQE